MTIKAQIIAIQQALASRGFNPGNIDGIWGRRTEAAVRAFQTAKALLVDGIVGRETLGALGLLRQGDMTTPAADALDDPAIIWLQEARRLLGVTEKPGRESNRVIIEWANRAGIDYAGDDIAWCGLFVAHCISATLSAEPLPANPLGARNWAHFGGKCTPQPGAVMVFWRVQESGWKGHVGFYVGEDDGIPGEPGKPDKPAAFHILGGNQNNAVTIVRVEKERLIDSRWPATAPLGNGQRLERPADGELSSYEA